MLPGRKIYLRLAVLSFALVSVLTGCGSGGNETTTADVSRGEILKQANAICARAGKEISQGINEGAKKLAGEGTAGLGGTGGERLLTTVTAPTIKQMAKELSALPAPGTDAEKIEAIVREFEAAAVRIEQNPAAAIRTDQMAKAAHLSASYGLLDCSYI